MRFPYWFYKHFLFSAFLYLYGLFLKPHAATFSQGLMTLTHVRVTFSTAMFTAPHLPITRGEADVHRMG